MVLLPSAPDPPPQPLPLTGCPVQAGFPSPAEDYLEGEVDLNRYLVDYPAATYLPGGTPDAWLPCRKVGGLKS